MTFYDRLMVETPRPCFGDKTFTDHDLLDGAHVIEVSDVARFFWERMPENNPVTDPEGRKSIAYRATKDDRVSEYEVQLDDWFGFKWTDLGCVRPPFYDSFFEFRMPQPYPMKRANGKGIVNLTQMGTMVTQFNRSEVFGGEEPLFRGGMRLDATLRRLGVAEELHNALFMMPFLLREGEGLQGPLVTWLLPLDESGCMFLDENNQPILEWMPPRSAHRHDDKLVRHFAQVIGSMAIVPTLMACQVMNTPEDEDWHTRLYVVPPNSQQKKYLRRHDRPMVSYTEIKIGGIKRRIAEKEEVAGHRIGISGVMKALHDVRQHSRTYRRSFFGSTLNPRTGRPLAEDPYTVIVPPHKRGSAAAGRRDHSYKVSPHEEVQPQDA